MVSFEGGPLALSVTQAAGPDAPALSVRLAGGVVHEPREQLVRSALTAFSADARWHDRHGPCHGVGRAPLLPVPSDEEREWDWT